MLLTMQKYRSMLQPTRSIFRAPQLFSLSLPSKPTRQPLVIHVGKGALIEDRRLNHAPLGQVVEDQIDELKLACRHAADVEDGAERLLRRPSVESQQRAQKDPEAARGLQGSQTAFVCNALINQHALKLIDILLCQLLRPTDLLERDVFAVRIEELTDLHLEPSHIRTDCPGVERSLIADPDLVLEIRVDDLSLARLDQLDQFAQADPDGLQDLNRHALPELVGLDFEDQLHLLLDRRDVSERLEVGRKPADAFLEGCEARLRAQERELGGDDQEVELLCRQVIVDEGCRKAGDLVDQLLAVGIREDVPGRTILEPCLSG